MNCLEFRRITMSEPLTEDPAVLEHKAACASCHEYHKGLMAFESELVSTLSVTPPSDLSARIMMNATMDEKPKRRLPKQLLQFATAASVAFAVFLVAPLFTNDLTVDAMVLEHIDHEPYALEHTLPAKRAMVAQVLGDIGYSIDDSVGNITYAMGCIVRGVKSAHLVITGEYGPVTVMIMPNEQVDQPMSVQRVELKGIIVPTREGSIAIFGHQSENISQIESRVRSALTVKA